MAVTQKSYRNHELASANDAEQIGSCSDKRLEGCDFGLRNSDVSTCNKVVQVKGHHFEC